MHGLSQEVAGESAMEADSFAMNGAEDVNWVDTDMNE